MNIPNPLTPAGSLLEQHARSKSQVFVIAFAAGLHVVVLAGLLFLGCTKDDPTASANAATNAPTAAVTSEPSPTPPSAVTDTTAPVVPPVESGLAATPSPTAPISAPAPVISEPAPAAAAATEYKIVKGDTAYRIAKVKGVSVKSILDANPNVNWNRLKIDQIIQVPAPAPAAAEPAAAAASTPSADAPVIHTVKSGDTLMRIARVHGSTVKAIRSANGLRSDVIKVNQKLKIPAKAAATTPDSSTPAAVPAATLQPQAEPAAIPLPTSDAAPAIGAPK